MELEVRHAFHWLTFTWPGGLEELKTQIAGGYSRREGIGGYGHPSRLLHESGAAIYCGSDRPDQPLVVNVPGEVCDDWAPWWIERMMQLNGRPTRLDVAADVGPQQLARHRLVEMVRAWKRGQVDTHMDQTSHHLVKNDRPGEGWTAYFGGNTSRLKLRAYDRRGPLRLEFQWRVPRKGHSLNHLPEVLHRSGPGPIWRGMARENAWPHPWYQDLLNGTAVSVLNDPREDSTLTRACEQIRKQFGSTLWACKLIGMTFDDFAVRPENPKQSVLARLVQYAQDAELMGYSPETLHKELDRWLKTSKSK